LREEIERQIESGTNPQQAFKNSVRQIGHADELKGEFKKTCGTQCYSQCTLPQWSLLLWGVTGLVITPILSLVITPILNLVRQLILNLDKPFVHGSADLVYLSHSYSSWTFWLPNYVTFTTFTISGLVIAFARWHTKWTLLWISGIGLIGTMIVNLVCRFVFHGNDGVSIFLQRVDLSWCWFYADWMIFIIMGLFIGSSYYDLWLNKLRLQLKTTRD
jgi:hypothetical protein